jgi:oligopeptide/dipeptide ABC transporter ATP-binding protein
MRQRAMIGMGLMAEPALIIADEPTTALDVTVQRQVLQLLAGIRADRDLGLLFISHDVTVVGQVCERVLVMYAGRIVEDLPTGALLADARHPYTRALVAAVPNMRTDRDSPLAVIPGRPPDPRALPAGCAFAPRCPLATDKCREEDPPLTAYADGRRVACWHADLAPVMVAPAQLIPVRPAPVRPAAVRPAPVPPAPVPPAPVHLAPVQPTSVQLEGEES